MRSRVLFFAIAAVAFATTALTVPTAVQAGPYPGNRCVGDKLKAAGGNCRSALKAWSGFVGGGGTDTAKRDAALTKATDKMAAAWTKSEAKAANSDVDCADTTLSAVDMQSLITAAVGTIVTEVTTGLTLSNDDHAKCGAALLKAASDKCTGLLKAESGYIKKLAAGSAKRDAAVTKTNTKFADKVTDALVGCPTSSTLMSLGDKVDDLTTDVITNSIISPNVSDTAFDTISPIAFPGQEYEGSDLHPRCSSSTDYHYFVKRGTVNKLVMYYQGGGACWNTLTCGFIGTFDKASIPDRCRGGTNDAEPCDTLSDCPDQSLGTSCTANGCSGGGNDGEPCDTVLDCPDPLHMDASCSSVSDSPQHITSGLGDLSNPANPFKDWHIVFVSYCTGDIHFGDNPNKSYTGLGVYNIQHVGWHNARTAEKFAREHFVNPEEVFVTGSSAGAYGAFFNAPLHHLVWPASKFSVLGDAGNGIITPAFLTDRFPVWNFEAHLPSDIPGIQEAIEDGTGIPAYTEAVADFFPETAWAHYTSSYDGGTGGQTGFYNVMLNDTDSLAVAAAEWPTWWEASCEWNDVMRQQAIDTAAAVPDNYRYYIGTGSRHTMYGSDKVYTDTTGGVPTITDWINSMLARDLGWTNVECSSDCGKLLPGDPQPSPLEAPFEQQGPDVVVNCP